MKFLFSSQGWVIRKACPALLLLGMLGSFTACDPLAILKPSAPVPKAGENKAAEPSGGGLMSPKEKFAFHKWLVTEMQEQIFSRPLSDKNSAGGWANVLSQRGSIEGVYHGFVLSSEYIALEQGKAADIKALRFFGNEMAMMDFPSFPESDPKVQEAAAKYVTGKMRDSIYMLKRELGERIIREAEKRKEDREKLAAWYASIAARWAKMDIPFGLSQRNNKDEVFHFNWAKDNNLGMVQWELLNRAHRILNSLGGITAASPAGK